MSESNLRSWLELSWAFELAVRAGESPAVAIFYESGESMCKAPPSLLGQQSIPRRRCCARVPFPDVAHARQPASPPSTRQGRVGRVGLPREVEIRRTRPGARVILAHRFCSRRNARISWHRVGAARVHEVVMARVCPLGRL
jgi:hypothetical protein